MIYIYIIHVSTHVHFIPMIPQSIPWCWSFPLADLLQETRAASRARGEAVCLQGDADAGDGRCVKCAICGGSLKMVDLAMENGDFYGI